jgi:two-component system response regulator YesN
MYSIIIVDDEPLIKVMMKNDVNWEKYSFRLVGTASNGAEALSLFHQMHPDAVITDLQMPVMSGVELIRRLREESFQGPVLALSNYSDFEYVHGALTAGAFDYVLKANIDAAALEKALSKMEGLLRASREKEAEESSRDDLLKSQTLSMNKSDFRDWLLEEGSDEQFPQEKYNMLIPQAAFPLSLCTIFFPPSDKTIAVNYIAAIVLDIFNRDECVFSMPLRNSEFLFLVSEAALTAEGKQLDGKLNRLEHELSVLTPARFLITCCMRCDGFSSLRSAYRVLRHSYIRDFYQQNREPLLIAQDSQKEFDYMSLRTPFFSSAVECIRNKDIPGFKGHLLLFLDKCAAHLADPNSVRETSINLLWYLHDLNLIGTGAKEIWPTVKNIYSSRNADALADYVLGFLNAHITPIRRSKGIREEIQKVIDYINQHYPEEFSLNDMADIAGLNPDYFSRLFHQETGQNISTYVYNVRMRHASEMLASSKSGVPVLIKEIAVSVGFNDPYYFSKRFKEYFGVAPEEYHNRPEESPNL